MSVGELVAQLLRWQGTGRMWQLLVAAEYDRASFEQALADALLLGWVVVDIDPVDDPDDDLVVVTEAAL